ncbi:MAG: 50S ribosomal protein L1 [Candidatus Moranbacteria bacterium]|nr:50S ribosomal protein L1 [Candidatus Moranbacteria bacterium]
MKRGKKYVAVVEKIEKDKEYSLEEALAFVKANALAKFDESVEVHIKLGINPKKGDEQVRSTAILPHGVGRIKKVAVITSTKMADANEAGADLIGGEELVEEIKNGKILAGVDFDVVVATPEMMPKLAMVAKILGPKGLMPNPKTETVTAKVKEVVDALKKGSKVSFKNDDSGNIHQVIGRLSFDVQKLQDNFQAVFDVVLKAKPEVLKKRYVLSVAVCSTMGPGIKVKM